MSEPLPIDSLIKSLGAQAAPVRRLLSPGRRTVGWTLAVLTIAAYLLWRHGMGNMMQRWEIAPLVCCADVSAFFTCIAAGWAAFALSVPGRGNAWVWLPLPTLLVWMAASGWGCLRALIAPNAQAVGFPESADCLVFIVALSVPLSVLLVLLVRRAYPLRPVQAAIMIGLASASASAALLGIFHPIDSAASDLAMHAIAVLIVIGVNAAMGGRLLQPR
jgi:hypothetical protein